MTIRALHVCDFSAPYPGAFIRQLRMLGEELASRGEGTLAFAFPERAAGSGWIADLRAEGYSVSLIPEPSHRRRKVPGKVIRQLVADLEPEIVHSHFGGYDLATGWACRRPVRNSARDRIRPALIWHYRTAIEEPIHDRSLSRRIKDLIRFRIAGRNVDRCVAVTEALAEEAAIRGMGDRAMAVVAGCDTDTFRPDPHARVRVRNELGIESDEVMLLHLGWKWWRKGGDLLADAMHELERRGVSGISAWSVGAPHDELQAPVNRLEFTDAIHELHQASDIFISASRSEGFGNGLVEGMACARVTVAAMVDGQREVFDGIAGCEAVAAEEATALADGIAWLLTHRDRWGQFGAENRAHIVRNYSMRSWASRMADAYEDVVGDRAALARLRRAA